MSQGRFLRRELLALTRRMLARMACGTCYREQCAARESRVEMRGAACWADWERDGVVG